MSDALFRGWLLAWIVWSAVPFGALVLVMIHAVTGGRWGAVLAPALRPATALVPLAALTFLGIALGLDAVYPWASGTGAEPSCEPPSRWSAGRCWPLSACPAAAARSSPGSALPSTA